MKPAPRTFRSAQSPTRDRPSCVYPPFILTASSIATSSRVRLPPSPSFVPPLSFFDKRYASTSSALAPPALIPRSPRSNPETKSPIMIPPMEGFRTVRSVSSSAPVNAQPLERDFDSYDDGYLSSPGEWAVPPFTAEEVANLAQSPGARGRSPVKTSGKQAVRAEPREYEPTEADFGFDTGSSAGEDVVWADEFAGELVDPRQGVEVWQEQEKKAKRRMKKMRLKLTNLPPLQAGEALGEDEERYDMRKIAMSQMEKAEGKDRWFPQLSKIKREKGKVEAMEPGETFYEPAKRYHNHFVPLLEHEHEEELRAHAERQLQWSPERLIKEGYMIEDLGASLFTGHKQAGYIYQFARTGKLASAEFAFHLFKNGTTTEICRTHPHYDYVNLEGKVNQPPEGEHPGQDTADTPLLSSAIEKLTGSVYSSGKKFIRVMFEVPIAEIELGKWRLDVGLNDIAIKRQLEAIRLFNANPTEIERQDAAAAAKQAKYVRYLSSSRSDEDEAFDQPPRGMKITQTVLQGTNLRDKLLRAFQEDFVPYDTSASLSIGNKSAPPADLLVVQPNAIQPDDVDATAIPTPHLAYDPPSILVKNESLASWTKRYRTEVGQLPEVLESDPHVPLNPTQMRAIAMMLSERLSLVQGPPGTGKTRVIIETIKLLKQHWKIPHPILVTAHTNAAVDNLLGGLREHNVKAVRLGNENVVREDLKQWTVDRLCEEHPLYKEWEDLGKNMLEMDNAMKGDPGLPMGDFESMPKNAIMASKSGTQSKRRGIKLAMTREILYDADVICTTCLSAASWVLDDIDFPVVFLDEASMATEPLSLIPLMKGSSHVAIIGDHKQLPPVIVSETGQLGGLATSMFERLIHEHNIPSIMLDTQYRMHPQIAHFPNRAFYASALSNGTADVDGTVRPGFEPPVTDFLVEDDDGKRQNVTFVHHDSPEDPNSRSIRNVGEAEKVCDVVTDLLLKNPTLQGKDIGVITPYVAQIRQLTEYLRAGVETERKQTIVSLLGEERAKEFENIEIRTVDGFEGREKAVIIFSTVRNNAGGYIGFMADWRRLNVGLTRAKRGLIILGSADHLARAKVGQKAAELLPSGGAQVWRELMVWLDREGLILRED